jgi:hypothetical protein
MKTPKITTYFFFCFIAIVFSSFTSSSTFKSNDEEEDIILQGSLGKGNVRSLNRPFDVTKSSSFVTVYYSNNLSNINVEITDEYGQTVYSNTINPIAGSQLLIGIFGWDTGNYTIAFSNSSGGRIYGTFEISDDI